MNTTTLQLLETKTIQGSRFPKTRAGSLVAKWIVVEGKLICKWFTV